MLASCMINPFCTTNFKFIFSMPLKQINILEENARKTILEQYKYKAEPHFELQG